MYFSQIYQYSSLCGRVIFMSSVTAASIYVDMHANLITEANLLLHSLTHSFTHSLIHILTHSHTHSLAHSLTHSFTHSFIHSVTHSLTHLFTNSLTHLHIHLLTPFVPPCQQLCLLDQVKKAKPCFIYINRNLAE